MVGLAIGLTTQQATALVVQDYAEVLGRLPDPFGYNTLVPLLVTGYPPAVIRAGLAFGSPEAASLVSGFYEAILGRAPDSAGLQQTLTALADGATLSEIRQGIADSPEARTDVSGLYSEVLGRPADAPGLDQFLAALGQSYSLTDVRDSMAASPEAAGLITGIYQSILGRSPSAAELSASSDSLAAGGPAQVRATVANGAEAQGLLSQSYELSFGLAPPASTLSALTTELADGRSFTDTTQLSAYSGGGSGATVFFPKVGYLIPAQYSSTGDTVFLGVFSAIYPQYPAFISATTPVPVTGASAFPAGSDTIVLDVQTVNATPLSFVATLDGQALGGATISAVQAAVPFTEATQDQVTFTGAFGPGLQDLHIQVTSDPTANALVILPLATFDGNTFLLGTTTTTAAGTADIYPNPGPEPTYHYLNN